MLVKKQNNNQNKSQIAENNNSNNSIKDIINKVFSTELLLNEISKFIIFEERKAFFSLNKKINSIFRKSIRKINIKKIIFRPEIANRFPNIN